MKRLSAILLFLISAVVAESLLASISEAQLPPASSSIVANSTKTTGFTNGQCLQSNGTVVTAGACGGAPSGSAGGALTGTYPNPTIATGAAITSAALTGPVFASVAFASLPSAATAGAGASYRVSNAGTKGSMWTSDGTRWKPVNGEAYLASLDTASSNIANAETIVFQYQLPAGLWQLKDIVRLTFGASKSGTVDSCTFRIRVGSAGTTGDTFVESATLIGAASVQNAAIMDLRLETATTAQMLPATQSSLGYSGNTGGTSVALPGAVTLASGSVLTNATWISIGILSSGTTNTCALATGQLSLRSSAN